MKQQGLIRHLELAVILVAVGQGEVDDVAARVGDVEVHAVGGGDGCGVNFVAVGGGYLNRHLAKVLQEDNGKDVTVDGGLDGVAFGDTLYSSLFYTDMANAI